MQREEMPAPADTTVIVRWSSGNTWPAEYGQVVTYETRVGAGHVTDFMDDIQRQGGNVLSAHAEVTQ